MTSATERAETSKNSDQESTELNMGDTAIVKRRDSLIKQYLTIAGAVALYWFFSISMVFLNKYLLSSEDLKLNAPLFITWYQCVVSVALCGFCSWLAQLAPSLVSFPEFKIDKKLSREVLPLSIVFVAMITCNNLCLKHVGVAFYYVGRSLTTVFNVICTYVILRVTTSWRAVACCAVIIGGFLLGVNQEDVAGTLSVVGVIFGVLASLAVALNAIFTKKMLPVVSDNIWRLTLYNNLNASFLFLPLMIFSGEIMEIGRFEKLFSLKFWLLMTVTGVVGFLMSYVTGLQIQVASALTHNISGTAKAAAQTVLAVVYYQDFKPVLWWLSNAVVLLGSGAYTYVRMMEMNQNHDKGSLNRSEAEKRKSENQSADSIPLFSDSESKNAERNV